MAKYSVYRHAIKGTKAVKNGFSWPGFLFDWLWLCSKGLFGTALVVMVIQGLAGYFIESQAAQFFVVFLVSLAIGGSGNGLLGEKLVKRGYRLVATLEASSRDQAMATAFESKDQQLAA